MFALKCPVCGGSLSEEEKRCVCPKGHCYDKSKYDYVNLLMSNKSSEKRHGDDKLMVRARRDFLDKGYYAPLRDELCRTVSELELQEIRLLDVGCGEGYYTAAVRRAIEETGKVCSCIGLDISKEALIFAHRRDSALRLVVGSVNALPVHDGACNVLMSVFAPADEAEFHRVLAAGGYYIKAVPLQRHLMGLKSQIYDRPYENEVPDYLPEGFEAVSVRDICGTIDLREREDIQNLFKMTPYYYKTGVLDQKKLENLDCLRTETGFRVMVFRRK